MEKVEADAIIGAYAYANDILAAFIVHLARTESRQSLEALLERIDALAEKDIHSPIGRQAALIGLAKVHASLDPMYRQTGQRDD